MNETTKSTIIVSKKLYDEAKKRGTDIDKDIKEGKMIVGVQKKEANNGGG